MLLLIVLSLRLWFVSGHHQTVSSSRFIQEEVICDVEESIQRGCSKEIIGARSKLECTILCDRDTECLAASLDPRDVCLHHQLCHTSVPCPDGSGVSRHAYMARYCVHGTWDSSTESCTCHYGTYGDRCNKYHRFCDGLIQSGFSSGNHLAIIDPLQDGVSLLKIRVGIGLPSYCNIKLLYNSGKINFNRTWAEYVNGFHISDDIEDFWIGLRPWHILSTFGAKRSYALIEFKNGAVVYILYYNIQLQISDGGEYSLTGALHSRISLGRGSLPTGTYAGDCFSPLKGVSFSTWDRNNQDGSKGENCASLAGFGWWYQDDCDNPCQLLGWGLDNYSSTPPSQRYTFLGVDVARDFDLIKHSELVLEP